LLNGSIVVDEIEDVIGVEAQDAVHASAKSGVGIEDILEQIVERIPAPKGSVEATTTGNRVSHWRTVNVFNIGD
jgi:GTP-binding protein LepA